MGGLKSGGNFPKPTKAEEEILEYIKKGITTARDISNRRGSSPQSVYRLLKNLKKKGLIIKMFKEPSKKRPGNNSLNKIRLHAEHYRIRLIYKDPKYYRILKRSNQIVKDDNTIRLFKNSINIYSGKSFFSNTVQGAFNLSLEYWQRFFNRLENELGIIIIKPRYQNIKLIKAHYSETKNEIARDHRLKGEKLNIRCKDTGKLWLLIDNSHNLDELEFIHPDTAQADAEKLKGFMDDIRAGDIKTLTELKGIMFNMAELQLSNTQQFNTLLKLINTTLETVNNGLQPKKDLDQDQRALADYIG